MSEENILPGLMPLVVDLADLVLDPANARHHDERNLETIMGSLRKLGQHRPAVVQKQGMVVRVGNGMVTAARRLGWKRIAAVIVDENDLEATARAIADNRTSDLSTFDNDVLGKTLEALKLDGYDLSIVGFEASEFEPLLSHPSPVAEASGAPAPDSIEDKAEEPVTVPQSPVTRHGDVWLLGEHRLMCGDAREEADVLRALGGAKAEIVLTDPPYCSGAFQEAGREAGTWGDIASDNLSTRGYTAMMRQVIAAIRPTVAYIFTDWRMWINLFDLVESSGLPVRSMIVWDKGSPGLGGLWRPQHEIVMFSSRQGSKRREGVPAIGNVIRSKRTGNKLHYTEKPVDLIRALIANDQASERAGIIIDPFCGSGPTLVAAECEHRQAVGLDVEPRCIDVAVRRWEHATSGVARLEGTDRTFADVAAERGVDLSKFTLPLRGSGEASVGGNGPERWSSGSIQE